MPLAGKGMLLTSMNIDPSDEAEFNRWYDREHLEERVAIEGFLEARRYIADEGSPLRAINIRRGFSRLLPVDVGSRQERPSRLKPRGNVALPHKRPHTKVVRHLSCESPRSSKIAFVHHPEWP
jgi:hypothetical protein